MQSLSIVSDFFVIILCCEVSLIKGSNENLASTLHPTSTHSPVLAGAANDVITSAGLATKSPQPHVEQDDEGIPTWILVLVIVISGLIFVTCCLCVLKIYQWRNDQGQYSIWNTREPNVESMYARESGVLFEKLDVESSLCEDQCYEIPVDSYLEPQRIYIGGTRVEAVKEGIGDSIRTTEHRMSESAKRLASIGSAVEYCAVTDMKRESDLASMSESTFDDVSQRSSTSFSVKGSISDRVLIPLEENNFVEPYCKPLPVPKVVEPVMCETYQLSPKHSTPRANHLVNRPLPQTPEVGSPPSSVMDSCASLDRSLLKQQKQNGLDKKVTFRTMPRKLRQFPVFPVPFVNAVSKATSNTDVSPQVKDHVACESRECTLTRIKKRMSRSLDTLINTERASHFYENPDVLPSNKDKQGHEESTGIDDDCEGLPADMEHLYSRISTFMDDNRHSYASVHYPAGIPSPDLLTRPKSRHTYISIIFGSNEPLSDSSINEHAKDGGLVKSHSCSELNTVHEPAKPKALKKPARRAYVNIDIGGCPDASPDATATRNDDTSRNSGEHAQSVNDNTQMTNQSDDTFVAYEAQCPYVNVNDALQSSHGSGDHFEPAMTSHVQNSGDPSESSTEICNTGEAPIFTPSFPQKSEPSDSRDSHYGVPKHPAIPLKRFQEIAGTVPVETDTNDIGIYKKVNGLATDRARGIQAESARTLSTYLEGRFSQANEKPVFDHVLNTGQENVGSLPGPHVARVNGKPRVSREEPHYENFISRDHHSSNSLDTLSTYSNDRLSIGSSVSLDENEPFIRSADENGNSVAQNRKLHLRQDSKSTFLEESVA